MKTFTVEEVAKHNKADDIWIIIDGKVFDLTKFINDHPGGKKVLLKKAGKDASKEFKTFHNEAIMQRLGLPMQIGVIGTAETAKPEATAPAAVEPQPAPVTTNVTKTTDIRQLVSNDQARFGEVVKRAAELGILNIASGASKKPGNAKYMKYPLPAGLTIEEFDIFHEFVCIDEIARCGSGGFIWALMGGLGIGLPPVLNFGSEELKAKVVPGCLSGEKFIALAVTEPSAGSDVANLKTTAKDMGDHYLLNGEKKWITQGGYADYYTVACRTGGPGMGGVSLLLVERTMPGVNARFMDCQGMWGSGTSYITFEDVKVPKSHIIGKVNHGFRYIMHNFNHERLGIVMQANRLARVCIEEALKYSLKRKTFGQRLIEHAVIRNKLGHMIRQCEATHAWLESVLYQVQTLPENVTPNLLAGPIALLKAQSTQTFEFCAREASQIFGGLAYTRGGQGEKIERLYREVRAYAIPGGSEEIMLDLGVRQALSKAIAASKPKL
ncbi:Putative Acyl-CoA dehydrogenase [Rhizopus microsporus]|nr:Putative Acyl-CoA dehydrogenase [Rhizopus microsporus]